MSLLDGFENRLESVFEGFFSRSFKTGVQPLEIAKKLVKEMDGGRSLSITRTYAPNEFTVWLSQEDTAHLGTMQRTLARELADFLAAHAKERGYRLVAKPRVELHAQKGLRLGEIEVSGRVSEKKSVQEAGRAGTEGHTEVISAEELAREGRRLPPGELVVQGKTGAAVMAIKAPVMTIGRAEANDLILPDPSVSRFHAEVEATEKGYVLRDLSSTNGTFLNGVLIASEYLEPGDRIRLGETEIEFRSGPRD